MPCITHAQDIDSLFTLSLDELMNIPIQSASKKKETLFEAPLSSYTITAAEIERSGATSIPDALRLAPGVIVREQSNGTYDVSIRGLDNLTQGDVPFSASNLSTLVMIDNRPVFNNNLGGVFWETVPIDLVEVEQIEIVRGPSAPLFGPNAVSGVINIITRRAKTKNKVHVCAMGASPTSPIATAFYGTQLNSKLSLNFSLNYQTRERWSDSENVRFTTDTQGRIVSGSFVPTEQLPQAIQSRFPDIDKAVERLGGNAFVRYQPADDITLDFSGGYQTSGAMKLFVLNTGTNLGFVETQSGYGNMALKYKSLNVRTSYWGGHEDVGVKAPPGQYLFNVYDAVAEYELKVGAIGMVVPGVSFLSTTVDDSKYTARGELTYIGRKKTLNTNSAYLRTDWNFTDAWRIIAAARVDQFSEPDDAYLAYEFAFTYTFGKNLFRAAVTRSNSGSFVGVTATNFFTPDGVKVRGNDQIKLYTVDAIEIGIRSQITKQIQFDIDAFRQKAFNVSASVISDGNVVAPGIFVPTLAMTQDTDIEATQVGITASINFVASELIQFKPFLTWQKTDLDNLPSAYVLPSIDPTLTYSSKRHKASPSLFGGWYLNVNPGKWNVNVSGFYIGEQDIYFGNLNLQTPVSGLPANNDAKFLLNARVAYAIAKQLSVFVLGRNILHDYKREFSYADKIGSLWALGVDFNLK